MEGTMFGFWMTESGQERPLNLQVATTRNSKQYVMISDRVDHATLMVLCGAVPRIASAGAERWPSQSMRRSLTREG